MTMTQDTELDFTALPQIVTAGDTARARLTDPWSSHLAADRSQDSKPQVKAAVLALILSHGPLVGSRLNDLYEAGREGAGWPDVHRDSPRKRAGELAADGILRVTNADSPRGHEHEYELALA